MQLFFLIEHEQVVMKDRDAPIQTHRKLLNANRVQRVVELALNEFTDNSDRVGLFGKKEAEPYTFLALEALFEYPAMPNDELFKFPGSITIVLSDSKHSYERTVFSLIELLGEVGGLFGAISGIPALLIAPIVENLFVGAVAQRLVFKEESPSQESNALKSIVQSKQSFSSGQQEGYQLDGADV